MTERSDYDKHMDALAIRIGRAVEGEKLPEVIFACCAVIAGSLEQLPPQQRREVQAKAFKFLSVILDQP